MQLKIKKTHAEAVIPKYQTAGAACFDLHAIIEHDPSLRTDQCVILHPGEMREIRTGLAFDIPEGHALMAYSRSGHGFNHGVSMSNSVGVVDSDYVGEVRVSLINHGTEAYKVKTGDRIAQAMLIECRQVEMAEVDELKETDRGSKGYGSTGR